MNCNKTYLIFLIANLLQNEKVTNGSIIKIDKIKEFCKECTEKDIIEILECFVQQQLVIKTKEYNCKNGHIFTLNNKNSYECDKCIAENLDEEEYYIDESELDNYFIRDIYRINKNNDKEIWEAKSLYLMGDIEKAILMLKPYLKEEDKTNKQNLIEKIAMYLDISVNASSVTNTLMNGLNQVINLL